MGGSSSSLLLFIMAVLAWPGLGSQQQFANAQLCCQASDVPITKCEGGECFDDANGGDTTIMAGHCQTENGGCTPVGQSCTATCGDGFSTSGATTFRCVPATRVVAGTQVKFVAAKPQSQYRSQLGTRLTGRRRRRAPNLPDWESTLPLTCTRDSCRAPQPLANEAQWAYGVNTACVHPPPGGFFKNGTTCTSMCKQGYYASYGSEDRTCHDAGPNGDMVWSGDPLVCTKAGTCPTAHGERTYWLSGCDFGCEKHCTQACVEGFQRMYKYDHGQPPLQQYTCDCPGLDGRGNWSSDNPADNACVGCVDRVTGAPKRCDCDGAPEPHAVVRRGVLGDLMEAACEEGFTRAKSSSNAATYTCNYNVSLGGWWSATGDGLLCQNASLLPHATHDKPLATTFWDYLCVCVTGLSALCIPVVIRRFRKYTSNPYHNMRSRDICDIIYVACVYSLPARCFHFMTISRLILKHSAPRLKPILTHVRMLGHFVVAKQLAAACNPGRAFFF